MEWLLILGSVASIVSVLAVLLGFARRRESITERGFKMLFSLVIMFGLAGVGAIVMAVSPDNTSLQFVGGGVAALGAFGAVAAALMIVNSAHEDGRP